MLKTYTIEEAGNYGVIYCLTSPNGKYYIGQSWNVKHRFYDYKGIASKIKRQRKIYYALKKYGPVNFKYEIIDLCETQLEMNNKEQYYIILYDSLNNGYNCTEGGGNARITEETKIKMSMSQKGEKNGFFGKTHSDETKEKLRQINLGKKASDQTREKMKVSQSLNKNKFEHHTDISKNKIRAANDNFRKDPNNKEIIDKHKRPIIYRIWFDEKISFITNNTKEFYKLFSLSSRLLKSTIHKKYNRYWHIEKLTDRFNNEKLYNELYELYIKDEKWKIIDTNILNEINDKMKIQFENNKIMGYGLKKT